MATKTISIRVEDDEHQALLQRAEAAGSSLAEYVLGAVRLGVSYEDLTTVQMLEHERRRAERAEQRVALALQAQAALAMLELLSRQGIDATSLIDKAHLIAAETMAEGDDLEDQIRAEVYA